MEESLFMKLPNALPIGATQTIPTQTMKQRIHFKMICAHKHLRTNALMTLPIFIIKPEAIITKAAVASSGYIENCSSITVSCSIVITHLELCRAWWKTEKSISGFFALGRFLINLLPCLFGRLTDCYFSMYDQCKHRLWKQASTTSHDMHMRPPNM